jgi:hypothetical protein
VTDPASLQSKRVQLTLTDSGAVVLASLIGPAVDAIEGSYLGDSASSYLVAMAVARTRSGSETNWRGEHLAVSHALVASIMERRFSPSRTALASGLAAVGISGATIALRGRGVGGGGGPGSRPPVVGQ